MDVVDVAQEKDSKPGTAGPGNILGCCLVSLHFLCDIHFIYSVELGCRNPLDIVPQPCYKVTDATCHHLVRTLARSRFYRRLSTRERRRADDQAQFFSETRVNATENLSIESTELYAPMRSKN